MGAAGWTPADPPRNMGGMSTTSKQQRRLSDEAFDALCRAYYVDNHTGGNLHVVLDEEGTSDFCLGICLSAALLDSDWVAVAIIDEMLRMPERDRQAYHDFVNARAEARRRGEPDSEYVMFSSTP